VCRGVGSVDSAGKLWKWRRVKRIKKEKENYQSEHTIDRKWIRKCLVTKKITDGLVLLPDGDKELK